MEGKDVSCRLLSREANLRAVLDSTTLALHSDYEEISSVLNLFSELDFRLVDGREMLREPICWANNIPRTSHYVMIWGVLMDRVEFQVGMLEKDVRWVR